MHRRFSRACVLVLALAAGLTTAVALAASDSDPDATFGAGGEQVVGLGESKQVARPAVDVLSDGSIVAAVVSQVRNNTRGLQVQSSTRLEVFRLKADGSPFTGSGDWDENGHVAIPGGNEFTGG